MTTISRFEDLMMFQKARELTREVYKALARCRDGGFRDQIQRASVSVLSNIAEGFESGTKQEFLNYLFISKASAGEVRAQTYVGYDVGYLSIETFKYLNGLAEESGRLIASFILKLKAGGMSGLQHKRAISNDNVINKMIEDAGLEMTAEGLREKKSKSN